MRSGENMKIEDYWHKKRYTQRIEELQNVKRKAQLDLWNMMFSCWLV